MRVIDAYSIKPIDADGIRAAARATGGRVLTVEDHYDEGGLGDAVLNALAARTGVGHQARRAGHPALRQAGGAAAPVRPRRSGDRRPARAIVG